MASRLSGARRDGRVVLPSEIGATRRPRWYVGAAALLAGLVLAGCSNSAITDNTEPPPEVPPPPAPGVDAGVLRIEVLGIDASASSGGRVVATPTGDTPGEEVTVTVPTSGTIEWTTAAGAYSLAYEPPADHSLVGASERAIQVDLDETTEVTFVLQFGNDGPPTPPPPSEDCTVVVPGGQSPQDAVEQAGPGDVICLNGTFDLSLGFDGGNVINRNGMLLVSANQSGTPDQPIVLRNEPGQQALIVGDFDAPTNLYVYIAGSNWQVVGLSFETGGIVIGVADNVQVLSNTIRRPVFPDGNAGGVRTLGGSGDQGASNILVEGNLIEDIYGCGSGPLDPCPPGSAQQWDQVLDTEHLAGITRQGTGGTHIFRNNVIRRVPALTYLKWESDDIVVIEGNTFSDAQWSGQCRTDPVVDGNTYANVGREGNGCPRG